ncbi:hypothetical protein ACUAXY_004881 [Escherichia coli]|nr:hypothetical protein [Escherichia coli]EFC6670585.1 hypothetical protein [Escherichia coli]EFC9718796.1 hypothetical protein [Escherichia coli]EFD7739432.1 hypothetical protein [Escherichia coli]EFE7115309.1 hypothetical protein [Escherichia coli]
MTSRQPDGCGLSWSTIAVIKTGNGVDFQIVIWSVQQNSVNKNQPLKEANSLRYVLKLHEDNFFDEEGTQEISRCTERDFATILTDISNCSMYRPKYGTFHWPRKQQKFRPKFPLCEITHLLQNNDLSN